MANCPNKNLEEWKLLVASRGEDVAHYLWDKYEGNVPESESKIEIVKAGLKATNILQSPKADQFFNAVAKNKITGDFFWKKMQADLGVPKDQLEILKSFNTQDKGELISSLLGNYSFAIEINTAKAEPFVDRSEITTYVYNNEEYVDAGFGYFKNGNIEITEQQYNEAVKNGKRKFEEKPIQNSSYYSNLIVPGGTNYTENEIATPAITPSIKGHAQFATDQGIGWFRSDDKLGDKYSIKATNRTTGIEQNMSQNMSLEEATEIANSFKDRFDNVRLVKYEEGDGSKTRRILEVQSDLFQKGRDRSDLVNHESIDDNESILGADFRAGLITKKEYESGLKYPTTSNQFLQLLNQGSNWVTFFVKSIIQDSAKKGYEKVLFPSGNTASKVEGHTTLEEFKKLKEDRILELERDKKREENDLKVTSEKVKEYTKLYKESNKDEDIWNDLSSYESQVNASEMFIERSDIEINQLKQELERVEGPEGFGALKPIYNFYENTVTNILNKQYGKENVNQVTDEYGNTWNEIEVVPEREQQAIFLQKKEGPVSTSASPKTIALIKEFIERIGVNIKDVSEISVNGTKYDANGIAMLMQKLIQVVEGKEAQALPEEAMHFAVAIIKQTNPKLYKRLMSEINNYQMLQDVFDSYGNDPDYQIDGKPNVIKLKEEAIAKVLVETIINNNENTSEKPEMIAKSQSWWMDIIDSLKNLFTKSGFDKLSMDIISGKNIGTAEDINERENELFLQKSRQEEIVNSIKEISDKIKLQPVKNEAGGEEHKYFIDGVQITNRVSNITKTWYDILRSDKALTDSEYKKAINTLKADKGTAGHKDKEHAAKIMTDENGRLKSKDELDAIFANDNHVSFIDPNNNDMYILLRNNLRQRMETYPEGTVFLSEITVYDPKRNLAGTVDFLAITPEGKVNILDWKFTGLNVERYKDVPWYNVASWNRQMNQYKIILRDNYNIESQDFEQTRMIPIRAIYSEGNAKKEIMPKLLEIEIGDANIKNIQSDYLLPVGLQNEKVIIKDNPAASKKINLLLEKLNDIYAKLSEQKVLPSERLDKNEQLNALYSAIRQLQMRQDISPLLYQAKILNVQIQGIINKYNNYFKTKDKTELTEAEIEDYVKTLKISEDALSYYTTLDTDLEFLFEGELSEEDKKLRDELRDTVYSSRKFKEELGDVFTEFTVEKIGGTEKGEKVVKDIFSKWLGTTSTIQLEGMAALFKKANAAFGRAGMDTQSEIRRLQDLKSSFEKWAEVRGLSRSNMFNIIKKKGVNELIDQYQPSFYTILNNKIETKDVDWIKNNIDVDKYKEYLKEKIEEEYKRIDNLPRLGTEEQNDSEIAREKTNARELYNISTPQSVGWLLYKDIKKFPKDSWESNEWKELHKKDASGNYVNKPALDFYNYIVERNDYYSSIGYIQAANARVFLPWVRKGLVEKLVIGGNITIGEQFLRNISVDEEEIGFGKYDPISGKAVNTIPKYLTREFEGGYSEDLFRTMAMYNEFAIKFKYLSSIENQGLALLRLEQNKKAIATSQFGKTSIKDGEIQYTNDNNENSKLLEDMLKAIVYQQKYIENESFDQLLGKFGTFGKTLNDKLGFKMLPETLDGRQLSLNKAITQMNNTFQVTALGLNILSSTSNYFGGTVQGLINAGKYFTKSDYVSAEMLLLSNKLGGKDKQKILAALDYFIPFTENYNRRATTKLSLNKLDDQAVQDFLMVLMRKGDEAVQTVNFISFLTNTIVVDGKVVNAREYLRNTDEYRDFYKGTQSERDARADKFEKDVKAINEKQGVLALSTVVNGELVIPGIERKSDSVIELRRSVQSFTANALGSMTEENKRLLNLNIYGNSFMVFKNWIPRLVDVRMGNIKYNAASDAYEWGRTRMIARIITDDLTGAIGNLKNSLMGNDKGIDYIRQLYEKKRADYKADTNKELKMTEAEFIDLVRQNIKNQMLDVLLYASLWALFLGLKALAPDDDEDPAVKNQWNFMLKATDKFKDEIGYFYNPASFLSLVSKGAFPSMSMLDNYGKALGGFLTETYALGTGDEELAEKTNTIKYWMKTHPITNQAAGLLPMFYPELAKDLGIRMQSQYGIR